VAGIALACLVAVTFPFFSTVTAVIAALGDLSGAYALPALFVLARPQPRARALAIGPRAPWALLGGLPALLALAPRQGSRPRASPLRARADTCASSAWPGSDLHAACTYTCLHAAAQFQHTASGAHVLRYRARHV